MVDVQTSRPSLLLPPSSQTTFGSVPDFDWISHRGYDSSILAPTPHTTLHTGQPNYRSSVHHQSGLHKQSTRDSGQPVVEHASGGAGITSTAMNSTQSAHISSQLSSHASSGHVITPRARSSTNPALHEIVRQRQSQPISRTSSRPASPVFQQPAQSSSNGNVIVPYLQLPSTISHSQGSLAEFAAQITCLFWFESSQTVAAIENPESSPSLSCKLIPEAYPATGFMKWVTTILSTTQVTQNVILLALLFVYRLKKQCPNVKGKLGSEYRLLTVALMLGNKFLDDNTYTNKTWAEVSGISVHEIHVMEVEFLSHMKYNLYTSKDQWDKWHLKLSKFWTYFDRASRKWRESAIKQAESRRPSLQVSYALPSPPVSSNDSPPYGPPISPSSAVYSNPTLLPPHLAPYVSLPSGPTPDYPVPVNARKRSYDGSMQEPPAKRQSIYGLQLSAPKGSYGPSSHSSVTMHGIPPLPMPNPMPSYGHARTSTTSHSQGSNGSHTPPAHLPPVSWLAGVTPPGPPHSHPPHLYIPNGNHSERSNQHISSTKPSTHPSSASTPYAPSAHALTPNQLSPSHFLTSRSSPYRPVRNMSTLLVPPPSGSLQQPAADVSQDQMRWQPLGKNADEHSGRVPYLHREAWPVTHQFNQWPSLYSSSN